VIVETDPETGDIAMPLITGMICSSVITVTILIVSKKCCKKQKDNAIIQQDSDDEKPIERAQS